MQCPKCHTQGKGPFCNECGQKMEDLAILMCKGLLGGTTCGKVRDPNINFCSNCGASASSMKSIDQEVLCRCGENIPSDKQFCANCGTKKSTRNGVEDNEKDEESETETPVKRSCKSATSTTKDAVVTTGSAPTRGRRGRSAEAKEAIKLRNEEEEESETETPVKHRAKTSATSTTKDAVVTNETAPTLGRRGRSAESLMDKQSKTSRSMDVTPVVHRTAKKPQSTDAKTGRGSRDRPSTPENQSMMSDAQKTSNPTMETSLFDIDASAIQPDVSLLTGGDMSRLRSNVGSGRTRSRLRPDDARDDTLCQSNLSNTPMLSSKPKQVGQDT